MSSLLLDDATHLHTDSALDGASTAGLRNLVRDVVVVASSSRGGSSLLAEILRTSTGMLHLRGEVNPIIRLAGLSYPDRPSDALGAEDWATVDASDLRLADAALAHEIGRPVAAASGPDTVVDIAWRALLQWPDLELRLQELRDVAGEVLTRVRTARAWAVDEVPDPAAVQVEFSAELMRRGHDVDPALYDMTPGRPERELGHGRVIEEPPFITTRPWQRATAEELASRPLVVKSPSNSYRIDLFAAMFPRARIRVIHLLRNPAASVNGLIDGWNHWGFQAHRVPEPLAIDGYDASDHARRWWKFDLPPGWDRYTASSLPTVCAFQWRSAHAAVVVRAAAGDLDVHRLRFEDLLGGDAERTAALGDLAGWLGVADDDALMSCRPDQMPAVMATRRPHAGRWRLRGSVIADSIAGPTADLAGEIGYSDPSTWL